MAVPSGETMSSGEFVSPRVYVNDVAPDEIDEDPTPVLVTCDVERLKVLIDTWRELAAELSSAHPQATSALKTCADQVERCLK